MPDKNFGGVIWTNHALKRLSEHGIKQGDAWATFRRPEQSRRASVQGAWVYYRTYPVKLSHGASGYQRIEVVAKQNERKEWLILSVWSHPVYPLPKQFSGKRNFMDKILEKILGRFKQR